MNVAFFICYLSCFQYPAISSLAQLGWRISPLFDNED